MDIVALSSSMAMQSLQNAIAMTMLSKTMNQSTEAVEILIKGMETANPVEQIPSFGHSFDVRA